MAVKRVSDSEVISHDGFRIICGEHAISYMKGDRYLSIPVESTPEGLRVHLSQTSPWMQNGRACEDEGTLNLGAMRERIIEALTALGKKFTVLD
jgi:hypothetical protein